MADLKSSRVFGQLTVMRNIVTKGEFVGNGSGLTGTASLRATETTKADVGLDAVRNVTGYSQTEANARFLRRDAGSTIDVGRGNVYVENNYSDNVNGSGITLRASINPSDGDEFNAGSIFAIRSSGNATRLWVGQTLTSTGQNDFQTNTATIKSNLYVDGVITGNAAGLKGVIDMGVL